MGVDGDGDTRELCDELALSGRVLREFDASGLR